MPKQVSNYRLLVTAVLQVINSNPPSTNTTAYADHGLRAENRAHHWLPAGDPRRRLAEANLRELFIPVSARWRELAVGGALELISRASRHLAETA